MKGLLAAALIISPALHAATYVVPTDAELIAASKAIVVGTVLDSYARPAENGLIETVTRIAVEERIKGLDADARTIEVVQLGGRLGDEWMSLSGTPVLSRGTRYLLFLDLDGRGNWRPHGLALGVFRFDAERLMRAEEIFGWDEDGGAHVEEARLACAFLDYVRGVRDSADYRVATPHASMPIAPHATFKSSSYAFEDPPKRRNGSTLTAAWRVSGSIDGLDGNGAIDGALANWNAQSSLIHYTRSATPASGDAEAIDGENRIIFNDPHEIIPGSCCTDIIGGTVSYGSVTNTHPFNGEAFVTIVESDITFNDRLSGSLYTQEKLNVAMTHELGHSLGLRHSDYNALDSAPCDPAKLDCCGDSNDFGHCKTVMNSSVVTGITGLQPWDARAIDCLYDAVCTFDIPCVAAAILEQPRNTVRFLGGSPATLEVSVSGTPPFTKQWYAGTTGDTSTPAGSDWSLRVSPNVTTSYWLRFAAACGAPVDTVTATVTVEPCPAVVITSAYATNGADNHVTLTATADGATNARFRWFRGTTPGSGGAFVGTDDQLTTTVTERTSFWVSVEGRCGNSAVSELVDAAPCGLPSIKTQPASATIASGATATLSVTLTDIGGAVTWYRGFPGDKSAPVGEGTSAVVGPLTTTTNFWGAIANACGEIRTRAVTVNISSSNRPARARSVRH